MQQLGIDLKQSPKPNWCDKSNGNSDSQKYSKLGQNDNLSTNI